MNKRLLIITCHRLCDNNGGANASKGFLQCFASLFDDCSLIYPEFDDTAPYIPAAYKLFPCHDGRPRLLKGLDMYRGVVGGLYAHVKRHLRNHQYDIIVVDHSAAGTSLVKTIKRTGAKLITIHHNVERDYLRDNGKERPLTYRLPYNYFARKSERDCLRYSDVNLTVTAADAQTFCSWYPERELHVHPWGIFAYRPIVDRTFPCDDDADGSTFVVTGSLCFLQSLQPILEFLRRYWPLVREACPQARLIIAGRNPGKLLIDACANTDGITIIPNPADMSQPVSLANYYVCPINAGSGFKLRVMDGLRQGLPVLCHRVSAAGYESMAAAGCLFAYDDELSFADSLRRMVSAKVPPATVYQTFRRNYSTEAGTERLRTILKHEGII